MEVSQVQLAIYGGIKMIQIEKRLEFHKIKEIWAGLSLTAYAKEQIMEAAPLLSENELLAKQRETTEAKTMLEKLGTPPLVSLEGLGELLGIAEKGDCLTAAQLEQLEAALVAIKRLKEYLNRGKQLELSLAWYEENLAELAEIRENIRVQIRNGQVDDYASKLLHSIRSELLRLEEKRKEKADAIIKSSKECMSDSFSTFRNGHLCVPVKKEYKFRVSGSVIDKSATGNTLFIEPVAVAKYSEELQLLKVDEENEERRILYELTAQVAEQLESLKQNVRTMERLDFIFSKGKLSVELDCREPKINTDRYVILEGARHPLMDRNVCVPQNFRLGREYRGVVITGPNTGGKTVAIKTVALNCMMAQCGLHVACKEADICMNSSFLCDIGDGQDLSENLSTFSAHITNVLDILRQVGRESLVVMDELGSGTDPAEGMGIAIAILEELRKSGCLFLVTTHYPEVKTYAEEAEGIINARMTFDRESLKPMYQMVIGEAGESCAFYIAARLGMPEDMLRTAARAAYGEKAKKREDCPGERPDDNCPDRRDSAQPAACADTDGTWAWLKQSEQCGQEKRNDRAAGPRVQKRKAPSHKKDLSEKFRRGDSVMIYPDKKLGIVCEPIDEKGNLRVQLPSGKIRINHKRVKLHVAAAELYPEDYDFSIIFDTVENRKLRHDMERKYVEEVLIQEPEEQK